MIEWVFQSFGIDDPAIEIKSETISGIVTDDEDCLDTLLENVEDPPSVFHEVFSDKSTSESSDKWVANHHEGDSHAMIEF